jgi:hypothetical protein
MTAAELSYEAACFRSCTYPCTHPLAVCTGCRRRARESRHSPDRTARCGLERQTGGGDSSRAPSQLGVRPPGEGIAPRDRLSDRSKAVARRTEAEEGHDCSVREGVARPMLLKTLSEPRETSFMPATSSAANDRPGCGTHGQGAGPGWEQTPPPPPPDLTNTKHRSTSQVDRPSPSPHRELCAEARHGATSREVRDVVGKSC